MEWYLMILLVAGFGKDKTPVVITGAMTYPSEEDCKEQAKVIGQWLQQAGVKAYYKCVPQLKMAGGS